MLADHIEYLQRASATEAHDWLLKAVEGELSQFSPLDEDTPATILARIYEKAPALVRETLQLALMYWIGHIAATASEPRLRHETVQEMLSLIDPILLSAPGRESTILHLRHLANASDDNLRLYALKGLIALHASMPLSFWREHAVTRDERFIPIVVEALTSESPGALFDWLTSASWSDHLQRSLYATLPLMFQTWQNAELSSAIGVHWHRLPDPARAVLALFMERHGLATPADAVTRAVAITSVPSIAVSVPTTDPLVFQSSAMALGVLGLLTGSVSKERKPLEQLVDAVTRVLNGLNGHSRPKLGWELGRLLAQHEAESSANTTFTEFWPAVAIAAQNNRRAHQELFAAHVLRGRTSYIAGSSHIDPTDIVQDIYALSDVGDRASRLAQACNRAKLRQFILAESEFHEDRLFCSLIAALLEANDLLVVRVRARKWGSLQTYDRKQAQVGFVNRGATRTQQPERAIYDFRRYHVFLRREWLRTVVDDIAAKDIQEAAHLLASGDGNTQTNVSLEARGWLAFAAGLEQQIEPGFGLTTWLPAQKASSINKHGAVQQLSSARVRPEQTYGQRLEGLLRGELDVFIGGAIHAELLQTWWSGTPSSEFVEVLSPSDFDQFGGDTWPPSNVLDFNIDDQVSSRHVKQIEALTVDLYRQVRKLFTILSEDPTNSKALRAMTFMRQRLAPKAAEEQYDRDLSFATPESMVSLLKSIEPVAV